MAVTFRRTSCYYCIPAVAATHVVHDRRGCHPACASHATWRRTTSVAMGHDDRCPRRTQAWRHVTKIEEAS